MGPPIPVGERAVQSVVWNLVLLPARQLLPLFSTVVVVRVLGVEQYGLLVSLGAITSTIGLYADLGVTKTIPKFASEIAEQWGKETLRDFLASSILVRAVVFSGVVAAIWLFRDGVAALFSIREHRTLYLALISCVLLARIPSGVIRGLLVAEFRTREINIIDTFGTVATPVLAIAAALAGWGVPGVLASSVAVAVAQSGMLLWGSRSLVDWREARIFPAHQIDRGWMRRFGTFAGFTYVGSLTRYFNDLPFAVVAMNALGLQSHVALLSIAHRAVTAVRDLATLPIANTLTALLGTTVLDSTHDRLRRSYPTLTRLYLFSMIPGSIGLIMIADPVLPALYGPGFRAAVPVAQVMAVLIALSTVVAFGASILLMYEQYSQVLATGIVGSLTTATLLLWLTPVYGALGAGIALGMGSLAWQLTGTLVVHRRFGLHYPLGFAGRVLAACTPLFVYVPFHETIGSNWLLVCAYVGLSIVLFLALLKMLGGVGDNERALVLKSSIPFKHLILRFI